MQNLTQFKITRMKKGLRQFEIANALGVSESLITKWETGRAKPQNELIKPLADILEVTVNEIADIFKFDATA